MKTPIHNTTPKISNEVFEGLADVISEIVTKTVNSALDERLGKKTDIQNKGSESRAQFKLPKGD